VSSTRVGADAVMRECLNVEDMSVRNAVEMLFERSELECEARACLNVEHVSIE
jgi:hypothetical protein